MRYTPHRIAPRWLCVSIWLGSLLAGSALAAPEGIHGTVRDEAGKPVPGALVCWQNTKVETDAAGQFTMDKARLGPGYVLVVLADGFSPGYLMGKELKDTNPKTVDIRLVKGPVREGTAVDAEGKGVGGLTITPRLDIYGTFVSCKSVTSDRDGHFPLRTLPPEGPVNILTFVDISGPDVSEIRGVRVDPKQTVRITVEKPRVLVVRVIDAVTQQPITHFRLRQGIPDKNNPTNEATAWPLHMIQEEQECDSQEGRFIWEMRKRGTGRFSVGVLALGYVVNWKEEVVTKFPEDKSWPLVFAMEPEQKFAGIVTDAKTEQPIAGARVLGFPNDAPVGWFPMSLLAEKKPPQQLRDWIQTQTDAAGHFEYRAGQKHFLIVVAPGHAPTYWARGADTPSGPVQIALQPGAEIESLIKELAKNTPHDSSVSLLSPPFLYDRLDWSKDGAFHWTDLPPGKAVFRWRGSQDHHLPLNLQAGQKKLLEPAFVEGVTLRCHVTVHGKPAKGIWVEITTREVDKSFAWYTQVGGAGTGADGVAVIKHVPAGRVAVTVVDMSAEGRVPREVLGPDLRVTREMNLPATPAEQTIEFELAK